jgi:hypothetical protein
VIPAAKAQTITYVTVGAPDATLVGTFIVARGIIVNGVATDVLIPTSVRVSNSDVDSACGLTALGFTATGDMVYALGVYTSGNDEGGPNGVYTSGNVYVGDSLQVVGGVLSGSNIQIVDGVISGSDLQVTGGYVTGACGN